jgi:hypothetical protein
MLTKALEGVRSVGAVKWRQFMAGNGREGLNAGKTEISTPTPNSKPRTQSSEPKEP